MKARKAKVFTSCSLPINRVLLPNDRGVDEPKETSMEDVEVVARDDDSDARGVEV
jgi:hypothetical protein